MREGVNTLINSQNSLQESIPLPKRRQRQTPRPKRRSYKKRNASVTVSPAPLKKPQKEPSYEESQEKRKGILVRLDKIKPLVLYLFFFSAGLLLVAQSAHISQINNQIIQQENRLDSLYNKKNYLEMKVIEQKSPERLEEIALENLKMENPDRDNVINIE